MPAEPEKNQSDAGFADDKDWEEAASAEVGNIVFEQNAQGNII